MKTLYESILDDEDVLIDDIKKSSNNWLLVLKQMIFNNSSEEDVLEFLNSKMVENDIKPIFKNFKPAYWGACLNMDDDYYDKYITLYGNSLVSTSKSPVILTILIKEETNHESKRDSCLHSLASLVPNLHPKFLVSSFSM